MSFENLSSTWVDEPLSDPDVAADAVDLMVSLGARRRGTLTVLICDPRNRYLATVGIELPSNIIPTANPHTSSESTPRPTAGFGSPASPNAAQFSPAPLSPAQLSPAQVYETVLDPVVPAVHTAPGTALVLALGRPGPAHLTDLDAQWAQAAEAICRATGVRLLGFYVATKDAVYQPALTEPAAA